MTLEDIKQHLQEKKLDAFLITRNNRFLGQDTLDGENLIFRLTGFTGSAGLLLVTTEKNFLFVDGRYEIQAGRQTDPATTEIVFLSKISFVDWLKQNFPAKAKIKYNAWCLSVAEINFFRRCLPQTKWVADNTLEPLEPASVFAHELQYCGQTTAQKCAALAQKLDDLGCRGCFLGAADSVSWLTNLRSDALPDTPVVRAMALADGSGAVTLFADDISLPAATEYKVVPFAKMEKELASFSGMLLVDPESTPDAVNRLLEKNKISVCYAEDPCKMLKACKNETEIKGMTDAHQRDGIAVCKFLFWLEHNRADTSELGVVEKIRELRRQQPLFYSESFPTIAGAGANSAVIHYQPTAETDVPLAGNRILLIDSGGQYFNGTTDITRTVALEAPDRPMTETCTFVLKAHIALVTAKFPKGTTGAVLDAVCRSVLWRRGLDYRHGTGHGVGCFLNVHEGPQSISARALSCALKENMVVSAEPGCYFENAFGVRIENLVRVAADEQSDMLKFVVLTLAPLDKRLIDKYLLTDGEIRWINDYHQEVYQKISPYLDEEEKSWLAEACSPL